MRNKTSCSLMLIATVVLLIEPVTSEAWNSTGHKTITSIICRRIPEERLLELADVLTNHPRYQEDFLSMMPESFHGTDPLQKAEWMLQQASIWPDQIRNGLPEKTAFNRPKWHYLPRAFYLQPPSNDFQLAAESSMNSRLDPVGGTANQELNGPQAFLANLADLNSPRTTASQKALALCWVLHIGEDLHQPCHTASLTIPDLFPEGDRGANSIPTEPNGNLHAVWDGPLGPDDRLENCRNLAISMLGNANSSVLDTQVSEPLEELKAWLEEGLSLERTAVYIDEVLVEVEKAAAEKSSVSKVGLTAEYLRQTRRVADERLLLAGIRMAKLLEKEISNLEAFRN